MVEKLEQNLMKVLSFKDIFLENLREIDMFTQPMALTYQKRYAYSTIYGVFFTLATVFLVIFTSIDNAVFAKYRYVCPMIVESTIEDKNYTIDLSSEMMFFAALNDIKSVSKFYENS